MPVATLDGKQILLDDEGFLADPEQWSPQLATAFAERISVQLTDEHWAVLKFLRDDYAQQGQTATLRRVATVSGVPIKQLFALFPGKPAKKMAYVAGLPKPHGCV